MQFEEKQITNLLEKAVEAGINFDLYDSQIISFLKIREQPHSNIGLLVKKKVAEAIEKNHMKQAPYQMKVFEKQWPENNMKVFLFSDEEKLCGKDVLDSIYFFKGNLFHLPPSSQEYQNVLRGGARFSSFIELFSSLVGARFEAMSSDYELVEMSKVESFEDSNIQAPNFLKKWLEKNNKETKLNAVINCKVEIKID